MSANLGLFSALKLKCWFLRGRGAIMGAEKLLGKSTEGAPKTPLDVNFGPHTILRGP